MITVRGKDDTQGAFDSAKRGASGLKGALLDVGKTAAGFLAAGAVTAGFNVFRSQLGSVFSEAREAREIGLQTAAVIKSTGGVAGVSAKQVSDYAESLSRVTNFDDESVQSAENLLLTFTSIGKDVFPQATETVLDMSQALGQDLKSSAIQLGKAMNDPILGATALRRVGVALTEQQMDQIKAFQESGDLLSAQKIIMKELAVEFGGSARATADPMKILGNTIANLKEQIGLALLPAALGLARVLASRVVPAIAATIKHVSTFISLIKASLAGDLMKAATLFNALPKPLQALAMVLAENKESIIAFGKGVKAVAVGFIQFEIALAKWLESSGLLDTALVGIKTIAEGIRAVMEVLAPIVQRVAKFFQDHKSAAIALGIALGIVAIALFPIPAAILAVILAVGLLRKNWDEIKAKTIAVWDSIPGPIKDALELIVITVKTQFEIVRNYIETVMDVIRDVIKIATALWRGDWAAAWEGIKQVGIDIFDGFVTDIGLKLGLLRDTFRFAFAGIQSIFTVAFDGLKSAGKAALDWLIERVNDVIGGLNKAVDLFNKINPGKDVPTVPLVPVPAAASGAGAGATNIGTLPGFSAGTPFVPSDGLAYLHRGERVVPAAQNASGGVGNTAYITINSYGSESADNIAQTIQRVLRDQFGMDTLSGPRTPIGAFSPGRA